MQKKDFGICCFFFETHSNAKKISSGKKTKKRWGSQNHLETVSSENYLNKTYKNKQSF